jgi:hypothetical protein
LSERGFVGTGIFGMSGRLGGARREKEKKER